MQGAREKGARDEARTRTRTVGSDARIYLGVAGAILLCFAIGAFALSGRGFGRWFSADPVQAGFHALLGLAAIVLAFVPGRRQAGVRALAILLLALGVLGTLSPRLFGYPERLGSALRWEVAENAAHLILGGWGAYVASREED